MFCQVYLRLHNRCRLWGSCNIFCYLTGSHSSKFHHDFLKMTLYFRSPLKIWKQETLFKPNCCVTLYLSKFRLFFSVTLVFLCQICPLYLSLFLFVLSLPSAVTWCLCYHWSSSNKHVLIFCSKHLN